MAGSPSEDLGQRIALAALKVVSLLDEAVDATAAGMKQSGGRDKREAPASFRVKAYLFSQTWLKRALNVLDGAHCGFWLGLLDRDDLQELTDLYYAPTESRYQLQAYNLSGLQPWESAAFQAHFRGCRSILVGSAGGGREVLALSTRCSKIDAFECNPQLLEQCTALLESRGVSARVFEAKPDEVPNGLGIYDGAILGWGAYIHILSGEQRIRLLRQFHRHLKPGGPFLLSFHRRLNTLSERLAYRIAQLIRSVRRAAPAEAGDWLTTSYDRRFTEEEIREELAAGGFETVFYSEEGYPHAVGRTSDSEGDSAAHRPTDFPMKR